MGVKLWLIFMLFFVCHIENTNAQNLYLLKGLVVDIETKEPIIGALIFSDDKQALVVTDSAGNFVLKSDIPIKKIVVKYIGYEFTELIMNKKLDSNLLVQLKPSKTNLKEVAIISSRVGSAEKVNHTQMGVEKISMIEAKLLPAILGEVDIIKILQLKPGVKSGGEGTAGFFVRGGSSDQNLILLEKAPVYNPNHLFGFFSVFNSDAINDVTLYKSGFPSEFGGRLSSVLDVKMRKSQADSIQVQGGIGLISSRLSVNVPIIKNKIAMLLSGRRTYVDLITNTVNSANKNKPNYEPIPAYFFYDFNGVLNYKLNQKNEISLNGYFGNDVFDFGSGNFGSSLFWGNRSLTLDWQHQFTDRLKASNAWFISGYTYKINNQFAENSISLGSRIQDQGFNSNWNYLINTKNKLQFGASTIAHKLTVGEFGLSTDFTDIQGGEKLNATELALFVSNNMKITSVLDLMVGLRNSMFFSKSKTFNGFEPRIAIKYNLNVQTAIKTSYARMYQYLHLVSSSSASLPTDIWYPSMTGINPQISDQVSIGLHRSLKNNNYFVSVETYYKWLHNVVDFRDGAQLFSNPALAKEFVFGKGSAYGLEAYWEKKLGRTTGWVGYTLAWTWRKFDEINFGEAFNPRYDRRHDVSVVIMHKINKRLSISGTWIYGTGNYATLAGGRFAFQDAMPAALSAIPIYTKRNDFQMPATHRMDLALVCKLNPKRGDADFTFSLYNVYSRRNPFFVYYKENTNENKQVISYTPTLVSLFPILPAITYNFKF